MTLRAPVFTRIEPRSVTAAIEAQAEVKGFNILAGKDALLIGHFPQLDWPNPIPKWLANNYQDWIHSSDIKLIGKDFFLVGYIPNYDQPNPTRPSLPRYQDHQHDSDVQLINKDKILLNGEVPNYDQPNPIPKWRSNAYQDWIWSNDLTQSPPLTPPPTNYDQPNPLRPFLPRFQDWIHDSDIQLIGKDSLLIAYYDWPNPLRPKYSNQEQDWAWFNPNTNPPAAAPPPPTNYDQPNPTRPTLQRFQDWLWFNAETQPPPLVPPPTNYDQPNPLRRLYANQIQDWIHDSDVQLIGKDALRIDQYDWPNPIRPLFANQGQYYTWDNNIYVGQDALRIDQYDWPNPIRPKYANQTQDDVYNGYNQLLYPILATPPPTNYDQPNPLIPGQPNKSFELFNLNIALVPPPAPPVITPAGQTGKRKKRSLQTWYELPNGMRVYATEAAYKQLLRRYEQAREVAPDPVEVLADIKPVLDKTQLIETVEDNNIKPIEEAAKEAAISRLDPIKAKALEAVKLSKVESQVKANALLEKQLKIDQYGPEDEEDDEIILLALLH